MMMMMSRSCCSEIHESPGASSAKLPAWPSGCDGHAPVASPASGGVHPDLAGASACAGAYQGCNLSVPSTFASECSLDSAASPAALYPSIPALAPKPTSPIFCSSAELKKAVLDENGHRLVGKDVVVDSRRLPDSAGLCAQAVCSADFQVFDLQGQSIARNRTLIPKTKHIGGGSIVLPVLLEATLQSRHHVINLPEIVLPLFASLEMLPYPTE